MIMFVPIANIVSGPIAGGIIQHFGWRDLFLFEGIGSFFLIIPWVLMVQEDPEKAKWISQAEKDYIVGALRAEQEGLAKTPAVRNATFLKVMGNLDMWKLIVMNFFYQTAIYPCDLVADGHQDPDFRPTWRMSGCCPCCRISAP